MDNPIPGMPDEMWNDILSRARDEVLGYQHGSAQEIVNAVSRQVAAEFGYVQEKPIIVLSMEIAPEWTPFIDEIIHALAFTRATKLMEVKHD